MCDGAHPQTPEFPGLMADIEGAVASLGGCVAPKLSWSSPHDAVWVSARRSLACRSAAEVRTLTSRFHKVPWCVVRGSGCRSCQERCAALAGSRHACMHAGWEGGHAARPRPASSAGACPMKRQLMGHAVRRRAAQVLLLLKSSDRVAHDICHAYDACTSSQDPRQLQRQVQHSMALRKWVAMRPEREFRCFVRGRELIGGRSTLRIPAYLPLLPVVHACACLVAGADSHRHMPALH